MRPPPHLPKLGKVAEQLAEPKLTPLEEPPNEGSQMATRTTASPILLHRLLFILFLAATCDDLIPLMYS